MTVVNGVSPPPQITRAPDDLKLIPRQATPPVTRGRVAILNEWYEAVGGAERTLNAMIGAFPGAETRVLWRDPDAESVHDLTESWVARTPLRRSKALALPLIPFIWRFERSAHYDVVIALSHAMNHAARLPVNPGGIHLAYVHTPARYLWLPQIDHRRQQLAHRVGVSLAKKIELRMSRHVTSYAANSEEVRGRIERLWGREARVINPPVRTDFYTPGPAGMVPHGGDYLLGVGRWVLYKNFDFMFDVAERAGLPLVIAGGGPGEGSLRARAARCRVPVSFEVRPDDVRIRELMRAARAFLFPVHEDFGIAPVEAQACGTPVVGLRRGGLRETVQDGTSGYLVDDLDPAAFARAVGQVGELDRALIRANAERFSDARFSAEVRRWVADAQGAR